jgi:hypothetical protein
MATCRQCGCTDNQACIDDWLGPCWWVEPDLCSHCEMGLDCDHAGRAERELIDAMSDPVERVARRRQLRRTQQRASN